MSFRGYKIVQCHNDKCFSHARQFPCFFSVIATASECLTLRGPDIFNNQKAYAYNPYLSFNLIFISNSDQPQPGNNTIYMQLQSNLLGYLTIFEKRRWYIPVYVYIYHIGVVSIRSTVLQKVPTGGFCINIDLY